MNYLLLIFSILLIPREEQVKIKRSYTIDAREDYVVVIDNLHGDVEVERSADNQVHVDFTITIDASSGLIEQAKSELELGEHQNEDSLVLFTKAPFIKRCAFGNFNGFNMEELPDYDFRYTYKVKVPSEVTLVARTIDDGDVLIYERNGPTSATNVNGSVEIQEARKVLNASSVNGDVTVSFLENPAEDIKFHTVNGDFHMSFAKDLNANVYFDSMNGDLFTAFDYQTLAPKVEKKNANGKFKISTKSGVAIGAGGPEMSFQSINGSVYLKKN